MSQALYRKYRSKSLGEIVGQTHVTDVLKRSLEQGRISHAYLLTGPRGVGKTSIARILAYEINKLPYDENASHLDIIEIDAASNNGVEDVRSLREKVQVVPVSANKKIYIIDEVHMLSKAAFNALLKTLEEPPEHAVFILATTDIDKLPATIISRTQRFSLRNIAPKDAVVHLKHIAKEEGIKIDDKALELIAQRGDGSFRDSISLLDQLRSLTDDKEGITPELVEQSLGLASAQHVEKLLSAYESKSLKTIVELLDESDESGVQSGVLVSQLIQKVRSIIADKPQLLPLLDQLLDVAKSSKPNIKLLTVLAAQTAPKQKNAALSAPIPEVSAPVATLTNQVIKQKPATTRIVPKTKSEVPSSRPVGSPSKSSAQEPTRVTIAVDPNNFDWAKLIEYARQNFVGIYSVLSKCSYEIDEGRLVIYTSNAFYKKKLDESKQRVNLSNALVEIGVGDIAIETIGAPPPPKDSTAAAVAAIMGGGEEVTVDA
jgi:DNA polymerase-3 subunit gamma/tau